MQASEGPQVWCVFQDGVRRTIEVQALVPPILRKATGRFWVEVSSLWKSKYGANEGLLSQLQRQLLQNHK